ncbi:MAG: type II secretion system F family protein [Kluyvera sp.]|uniref:type II secretion system F family protein n=1 Tax=Kluyvera sp. TaxID=1538228 RepID=UPI003F2D7E86
MNRYRYRQRLPEGKILRGVLDAQSEQEARLRLQSREGTLLMLRPVRGWGKIGNLAPRRAAMRGAIKQLALLAEAQLPLRESLALVVKQQTNETLRQVLEDVYRQVCQGQALSSAMARQPRYFDPLCSATVSAGEYSGELARALNAYADYCEEQHRLRQSLRQAVSYPLFLMVISSVVMIVLLTVAVPQIVSQLTLSGVALPWSTRAVQSIGVGIGNGLLPFAVFALAGGASIYSVRNHTRWRFYCDAWLLRLPLLGRLNARLQQVRLLMTLAILCRSAIPMADALRLSCEALSNRCFRARVQQAVLGVVEGDGFSAAVSRHALFPPDVLALLIAGEQGGRLSQTLSWLARIQRESLQQKLLGLVKFIEPCLILVLGLVVLMVFMAIIQPMLTMNTLAI